jgi:hypothetical protein
VVSDSPVSDAVVFDGSVTAAMRAASQPMPVGSRLMTMIQPRFSMWRSAAMMLGRMYRPVSDQISAAQKMKLCVMAFIGSFPFSAACYVG